MTKRRYDDPKEPNVILGAKVGTTEWERDRTCSPWQSEAIDADRIVGVTLPRPGVRVLAREEVGLPPIGPTRFVSVKVNAEPWSGGPAPTVTAT